MFNDYIVNRFKTWQTPFYYYDLELLEQTILRLKAYTDSSVFKVHYAFKANVNQPILSIIRDHGIGADCVSGNEIQLAVKMGFKPEDIVFAGVGKTDDEIKMALDYDIACFNCESLQELEVINQLAYEKKRAARVALRINPNVDANTHHYITTGVQDNKFGFSESELNQLVDRLSEFPNIQINGLHFHIGSQITDMNVFRSLCLRINEIQNELLSERIQLKHINLGGGLGIDYEYPDEHAVPAFDHYFETINGFLNRRPGQTIHLELGRSIVGQCGSLISKVLYVKNGSSRKFAILDAGFTELLRPALYQSTHKIENLTSEKEEMCYDIVGPLCESSDSFGSEIVLPETQRGDLIAIRSAGAYGEVMSSYYNLRNKANSYYSSEEETRSILSNCAEQIGDILYEINQHL